MGWWVAYRILVSAPVPFWAFWVLVGVVGWVVGPKDFHVILWHFENGASVKIDDVLAEDGGLLHVLPLAVHRYFFLTDELVGPLRTILTF